MRPRFHPDAPRRAAIAAAALVLLACTIPLPRACAGPLFPLPGPLAEAEAFARFQNSRHGPFEFQVPNNGFVQARAPNFVGDVVLGVPSAFGAAASHADLSLHSRGIVQLNLSADPTESADGEAFGQARNISHWVATGPPGTTHFSLDLHLTYHGQLETVARNPAGIPSTPINFSAPLLTPSVGASVRLLQPRMGSPFPIITPLFNANAGLNAFAEVVGGEIVVSSDFSTGGLWTPDDFDVNTTVTGDPDIGETRTVANLNFNRTFNNVASIAIGETFAIEQSLLAAAHAAIGFPFGRANSDFFDSGSFSLSTSTPGVVIQRVGAAQVVPEPSGLALLSLGGLALAACGRRARHRSARADL